MPEFYVFKAGKYDQGDWPLERVQKLVDAYDPEKNLEAPVVIGHRYFAAGDADQYAHGWVKSLRIGKGGKVYATIDEFSTEARHAIADKKLRYISIEILEFDKHNKDEPPYLRAVALLGRDTPAVAGTKIPTMFTLVNLAAGGVVNTVDAEKNTSTFTRKVKEGEIKALFRKEQEITQEDAGMDKTAEYKAALEKQSAELAAFKRENEELKSAGKKQDAESFFSKLRDEGKLPPAMFDRAVALDARLGEEDRKEMRALFSDLKAQVDLSGKHTADKKNGSVSAGSSSDLTAKIKVFQKEHGIASFGEAAAVLYSKQPEIFEEEETHA
ncbi:MAG: hypothetical protein LBG93_02985 [Treponema sp.]|jgi:hypothetical protein|nr:hypothetical protein [Treponema sp.]